MKSNVMKIFEKNTKELDKKVSQNIYYHQT